MEQQNSTVTHTMDLEQPKPNLNDMVPESPKPVAIVMGSGSGSESVVRSEAGGSAVQVVKRGRGRPRKYDMNGGLMSPEMSPPGFTASNNDTFESPAVKRSRGRPRGSGKLQILASMGGYVADTAGGSFTPHVVIVNVGEDVVNKILTFFQRGPRSVCILSATGAVSSVILRQPSVPGGLLKYEGRFEILSLAGSCSYTSGSGGASASCKEGMLSISLAKPDGKVFGGAIDSALIAAGPIQLVMATFKQNITKQIKRWISPESSDVPLHQDSESGGNKVPNLLKGEQSYPAPPTTPPPPPALVPKAIAIATATNGGVVVQDGVVTIAATNNGIANDDANIPTAIPTKVVPHVVITEDLNMDSTSVDDDGVDMDQKTDSAPVVDTKSVP